MHETARPEPQALMVVIDTDGKLIPLRDGASTTETEQYIEALVHEYKNATLALRNLREQLGLYTTKEAQHAVEGRSRKLLQKIKDLLTTEAVQPKVDGHSELKQIITGIQQEVDTYSELLRTIQEQIRTLDPNFNIEKLHVPYQQQSKPINQKHFLQRHKSRQQKFDELTGASGNPYRMPMRPEPRQRHEYETYKPSIWERVSSAVMDIFDKKNK